MPAAWRSADRTTRVALGLLALIYLVLPVVSTAIAGIPHNKHATLAGTVVALAIVYCILATFVVSLLRGRRWAWVVLLAFSAVGIIEGIINFRARGLTLSVVILLLLISPPVRRYVEPRHREALDSS
jgi:hypothetical protein